MAEDTIQMLRDAGFNDEADRIEAVTPEVEAAFDKWLQDPENARRWEAALEANRPTANRRSE